MKDAATDVLELLAGRWDSVAPSHPHNLWLAIYQTNSVTPLQHAMALSWTLWQDSQTLCGHKHELHDMYCDET